MRVAAWTLLLAMSAGTAVAEKGRSVQLDDCGENAAATLAILRTAVVASPNGMVRMYGELESVADGAFAATRHCHVVYRLWVGRQGMTYRLAFEKPWDVEEGEIAGIDAIGFSPDGAKAAANFWLAKGDWTEDRPVVADLVSKRAAFRSVGDEVFKQVKRSCDAAYGQHVDSVTNAGDVLISVPAYQNCPAGGTWSFSPASGRLVEVGIAAAPEERSLRAAPAKKDVRAGKRRVRVTKKRAPAAKKKHTIVKRNRALKKSASKKRLRKRRSAR